MGTTSTENKSTIHGAIDNIPSGGGANMRRGIELAFRAAQQHLDGGRSARMSV